MCELAGLYLDPWQRFVLSNSLGERADGQWAAFEVGVEVARQNGKGSILEGRELAGLFLLGERLIIHSAHLFDTSLEAFRRLLQLIEQTPDFDRRVMRVSRAHGEEGIELKGGQRIRFRTRTKGGGRGFTGDLVILDEAMDIPEATLGALMPTVAARPNPQIWYTGSAVDQEIHEHGVVFSRVRERGHKSDPRLAWFEWSVDEKKLKKTPALADDPKAWAQANPGLGIRITLEYIAGEKRAMASKTFLAERLSVGDWPRTTEVAEAVIDEKTFGGCLDVESAALDPVFFTFDVNPDRSRAAIAVAGWRKDGLAHIEVVDHRAGTGWVVKRLAELVGRHETAGVGCDAAGPAASLISDLEKRDVDVVPVSAQEHAQACGMLFDAVDQSTVRHLGTPELVAAIRGAAKRPLGEAWAWSRKNSGVDISPLVACTLAFWGISAHAPRACVPLVRRGN